MILTESHKRTYFKRLREKREIMWWAVCVKDLDTDPYDEHEYTIGYFGDFSDAKTECIRDMDKYIRDVLKDKMLLSDKDIRKYRSLKNDCIVGVETKYDEDSRFWLIKPVDYF